MNRNDLYQRIREKASFLCVGLDTEISKIPMHLMGMEDPVFEFNRQIIDATCKYAVAYKPNLAFYETRGAAGWLSLERTIHYLKELEKEVFIIADAKRGDIGNTSTQYAKAFFDTEHGLDVDAVTVAPYMGEDSVKPFLGFPGKWIIMLALTSNKGALDFQMTKILEAEGSQKRLFEKVLETSASWGTADQIMYVVGATQASMLEEIRKIVPEHFLLVPGVGAQGGSLAEVAHYGLNKQVGLLVNASRSILFASNGEDFAEKAGEEARKLKEEMQMLLASAKLI